jgi:hypothetical protein
LKLLLRVVLCPFGTYAPPIMYLLDSQYTTIKEHISINNKRLMKTKDGIDDFENEDVVQ